MRRHLQQIRSELVIGWLLAIGGTLVYLLTLEPTVSFWDSGEFIAVSHRLQVGHPPGAPLYQLLAHAFSWMAGNDVTAVARCCNALSAVAGGLTVMFLYWSILLLFRTRKKRTPDTPGTSYSLHLPAAVGALCYLFCDTAWFSAVESEVYSLAMLIASVTLWAMLRWYHSTDYRHSFRWLLLISLLLGMGICVHLLTLLTTPTLLILMLFKLRDVKKTSDVPFFQTAFPLLKPQFPLLLVFFFIIGLSPYSIIPIRAAANTPINEMGPATAEQFKQYFTREQYEKAPLYPRMWRHHKNDAQYAASWSGGDTTWVGNMSYYFSYQFTYMYLRYLMWNFSGRYNDRQGYGSPQNGQFLTGLPPLDRLLVGTSKRPPDSLPNKGHNIYYLLPLLLGLAGAVVLTDNRKPFWTIMSLFLMGGIILSVYLNHPTYEPRERDYAYILSFYAFCMAIGFGAEWITRSVNRLFARSHRVPRLGLVLATLLLGIPLLMACQNWDDHDRSHRYIAYDSGKNILNSCDTHPDGTVLFCYGDNDTFPLWYLQSVENTRPDIRVENIGIMGWKNFISLLTECIKDYDVDREIFDNINDLTIFDGERAVEEFGSGKTRELSEKFEKAAENLKKAKAEISKCEEKLKQAIEDDYDIEFGKFNIIKGRYWDDSELKVTVKNTSDTSIKFYFKIEARDADDKLIDSDTFYTKTLDAGASGEYTIFDYVSSSKYEKMSAEDVKYVVVTVEEN